MTRIRLEGLLFDRIVLNARLLFYLLPSDMSIECLVGSQFNDINLVKVCLLLSPDALYVFHRFDKLSAASRPRVSSVNS